MSCADAVTRDDSIACGGCGRALTPSDWYRLTFVGRWATDEGALELRVCTCGSTISRERPTLVSVELAAVVEPTPSRG